MSSRCILCEAPAAAEVDLGCGAIVEVCAHHVAPYLAKHPSTVIPLFEVAPAG